MFLEDVLEKNRIFKEQWEENCSLMPGANDLKANNRSGIELKSIYTPDDIMKMDYKDIGHPGGYPFTRGNYPLHYQVIPFMMLQGYGFGTAEDTRKRRDWLSKLGSRLHVGSEEDLTTTFVLALDLPTQRGLDPDDPAARGRIGDCGLNISTVEDFEPLFKGLPLDKIFTVLIGFDATLVLNALYAAYVMDVRKESLSNVFIGPCNYYYHQWAWDTIAFPPKVAMKLQAETMKFILENCPKSLHTQVEGYNVGDAGATPVQEVAFNIAAVITMMEYAKEVGLDMDEVAQRFYVHPHVGLNLFEEIAKFRASRRLWAKIFKERFGCRRPESLQYKIWASQTAGVELTAQEPLNNIIRTTIMAVAAMLAGVEGMWIASYDEALGIPTEEAVQVAVRTYQILSEETDIPYVTDPLGGSYYIEWLTNRMEEEITGLIKKMDDIGGYMKCWESGWIRSEVENSAYRRLKGIEKGTITKVGMNKYRIEDSPGLKVFRPPQDTGERAVERVRRYREERNHEGTKVALEKVKEAALQIEENWPDSCGRLMPALIEAARAGATLGEMHCILREVFGYGYYSG
ncbi:MAG: methylmalonyl-CoA mutase family protein [Thermodesulfobacteriota bacterium]|nr:methylmalonyl-CoA mutase family protein [Thermodesulfobacteriota bacterium]